MKNVEVVSIEVDEATETAKMILTPESEKYIQSLFPDMAKEEAVQAYWNLASQHLNDNDDLKV